MKSIRKIVQNTIVIKKSEFITTLIPCSNEDEISLYIEDYSKLDATHNCVAYLVGNKERANDDGEPSGTAGLPMLNVLKRQELSNIIAIVTRYFGGVKLGAGGLTRAYSNSIVEALKVAEIVETELAYKYRIDVDYHYLKKIDYLIKAKNLILEDTSYDEKVHYILYLRDQSFLDELQELTNNTFTYELLGQDYMPV
jgi:uncharacterized YigZ family protein